ncbi:MAG: DUF2007 domain-containing protein [Gammaproteobacteria bacterium]|nr:DUF2007 domain-containing protein [Gammaproteobacteria bacterium]MCP5137498.1 DUF2007 domain-containing protein [Gammaproteobacteria bacterium]
MKVVYRADNITEAHIVAGMLEAQGVFAHVAGHYLQGGVGELASFDFARVFVEDEDVPAAMVAIRDYEGELPSQSETKPDRGRALPPGAIVILVFLGVFALTYMLFV